MTVIAVVITCPAIKDKALFGKKSLSPLVTDFSDIQDQLDQVSPRAQEILRAIALSYVTSGDPVGSRTLSKLDSVSASAATIRNVMSDLEEMGLLYAPHTSAGRLPTESGLRLFVDGLMQMGDMSDTERSSIEAACIEAGRTSADVMESASAALSGLSACAGLVLSPKSSAPIKQIQFTPLNDRSALAILVLGDGTVENRVIELEPGTPSFALTTASNYLTAKLAGLTLFEARAKLAVDLASDRAEIDAATQRLAERGIATPSQNSQDGVLIVKGQLNLLDDVQAVEDLAKVKHLMASLESKQTYLKLMEAADQADGVKIFIGSQTELFGLSDCSVVIKPYRNTDNRIIGAVGVIGPMRLNYGRIIPMVDYTADVMSRLLK